MRVLITGAGGTLGTSLAPALADRGHEPVLQDVRPAEVEVTAVWVELRLAEAEDTTALILRGAVHNDGTGGGGDVPL